MRKWLISVLVLGMLCMMTGCKSEEEKAQDNLAKAEKLVEEGNFTEAIKLLDSIRDIVDVEEVEEDAILGLKYEHVPEGDPTELMEADLDTLGKSNYFVWSVLAADGDSIEEYLEDVMYVDWYKENKKKPVTMDVETFDDVEYGVHYIFEACEYTEFMETIIKLYEIGKEENVFYMVLTDEYMAGFDGGTAYTTISLVGADGEIETYRDISQEDYAALEAENWELSMMMSLEQELVDITYNSFIDQKMYESPSDFIGSTKEIVDYTMQYAEGSIMCNMNIKYGALFSIPRTYYVTALFSFDGVSATLIDLYVN